MLLPDIWMNCMDVCHSAYEVFKICRANIVLPYSPFLIILDSSKHTELVQCVNIMIISRWTFACMTKIALGKAKNPLAIYNFFCFLCILTPQYVPIPSKGECIKCLTLP